MVQAMFEAVVKLLCKWQRVVMGMTRLLQAKGGGQKTVKLCKSESESSGRAWANNWYTFICNWDYEILQWNGSAPKKKLRGFPHVFYI
jgi:hypothetical protein